MSDIGEPEKAEFQERSGCISCGAKEFEELSSGAYFDEPLRSFLDSDPWGENPMPYLRDARWSLRQCSSCKQVYHGFILTDAWNDRRFSEWMSAEAIEEFGERLGKVTFQRLLSVGTGRVAHGLRIEKMTRSMRGDHPVRLLDFGCGFGEFVAQCNLLGFDAVGVDRASARHSRAIVPILKSLDEVEGKFDAITLFEVLEHLDEPSAMIRSLTNYIKPGGILVLETPDCLGVHGIQTERDYRLVHPLEHINAYTRDSLTNIAAQWGYERVSRPPVHIATDVVRIAKNFARQVLGKGENTTQIYLRKK